MSQSATPIPPETTLERASTLYLERRRLYLSPRSMANYRSHFRSLTRFFSAGKTLASFHEDDFRDYQKWRSMGGEGRRKAGASCVNHETGALAQVLDLAVLWEPLHHYYERLPEPVGSAPRILTQEEEDRFFRVAARRPAWRTALNAIKLTVNTTISGCELRQLRLEHLQLQCDPPTIRVPEGVKNKHRIRVVPLNPAALEAARELLELARQRGSTEPEHYLIGYRVKRGLYDPRRGASSVFIRDAFRRIVRSCGLAWLTPTCFRHQAITKLLENGTPDETVRSIAGHVSEKAMQHYSHIRIEAKKTAVDRLSSTSKGRKRTGPPGAGNSSALAQVTELARRLKIPRDAAVELILQYERLKIAG